MTPSTNFPNIVAYLQSSKISYHARRKRMNGSDLQPPELYSTLYIFQINGYHQSSGIQINLCLHSVQWRDMQIRCRLCNIFRQDHVGWVLLWLYTSTEGLKLICMGPLSPVLYYHTYLKKICVFGGHFLPWNTDKERLKQRWTLGGFSPYVSRIS